MPQIQTLAHLRVKLQSAESLLESNIDVASILLDHAEEMSAKGIVLPEATRHFKSEILQYTRRQRCHFRNVKKHLGFAEDIHNLVSYIRALS